MLSFAKMISALVVLVSVVFYTWRFYRLARQRHLYRAAHNHKIACLATIREGTIIKHASSSPILIVMSVSDVRVILELNKYTFVLATVKFLVLPHFEELTIQDTNLSALCETGLVTIV